MSEGRDPDVVVLGSGPNGLTAACLLAEAGLQVLVLEAQGDFGGAVRSGEVTLPGFRHDLCSGFYPLFPVGPIGRLPLERFGLEWLRFQRPFGGGTPHGLGVTLGPRVAASSELFGRSSPRDAVGFRELADWWEWGGQMLLDVLYNPLGSPGPLLQVARRLPRLNKLLEFARLVSASAQTVADDYFESDDARLWFVGSALHSDLAPESAGGGAFSLTFLGLGQKVGMPIPRGGADRITAALLGYLASLGGRAMAGQRAERLLVRQDRVVAVRTSSDEFAVRKAVLATVEPQQLFLRLVGEQHLPSSFVERVGRFRWGSGTIKLDVALSGLPQFKAEALRGTGVLHLGDSCEALSIGTNAINRGYLPARPLLVGGFHTLADTSRAPDGQHTFWVESHVPYEIRGDAAGEIQSADWQAVKELFADRMLDELERFAPGAKGLVLARHVQSPVDLEAQNPNIVRGDIAGGSFDISQQLVFRPLPGWFRYRTPIKGLYLSGAATHPGGGVNGAAGANAARVLLGDLRLSGLTAGAASAGDRLKDWLAKIR